MSAGQGSRQRLGQRIGAFFALDDDWVRPGGSVSRLDVTISVVVAFFSLVTLELVRSVGQLGDVAAPAWAQRVVVLAGAAILLGRRRWPLSVAMLAGAHLFLAGITMPSVMAQITLQSIYFFAIFSGVAWARSRSTMSLVIGAIVLFMFGWLAWQFALGNALDSMSDQHEVAGAWFSQSVAAVTYSGIINVIYFGGAIIGGQASWRGARQRARLEEQASTIARQAEDLRRQAVVEERLRIARELHDVVAHHVSVIGIHAAAGRRMIDRDAAATREALMQVEQSTREAVMQMRGLLGTLRAIDTAVGAEEGGGHGPDRSPVAGLADLPSLARDRADGPQVVEYSEVFSPHACATDVPGSIGLSLYRVVQEALTNVTRHSTATNARVVLRVDTSPDREAGRTPYVEVEVTDNGRPRPRSSGSGMGQLGIRERARSHGGSVEMGPRATGGYRVRVRIPLGDGSAQSPDPLQDTGLPVERQHS